MKISEKNKTRLMVIPIVAMLAVTMVVAGWQHEEEQLEIDVDEGYDEIVIPEEEVPAENEVENYPQNKSMATTYVNNESSLEFEVEPIYVGRTKRQQSTRFNLQARGEFDEDLEIEDFQFQVVQEVGDTYSLGNTANISGLTLWEYSKQREHPESYGFDVDSNEFTAEIDYVWTISREDWEEPHTLELEAIVGGLSEDVTVSIDVHIEGGNEV